MVLLADGTLVVAEEKTNRIVSFAPGADTAHLLGTLPGTPTLVECHQGTDGIAWDPTTKSLVIPDAPTGTIYRLSTDGRILTRLAGGFTHPVGAAVDASGTVYVADECGGDVWRLTAGGGRTAVAPASMPDDVALDGFGNIIVTDVRHVRHSVTRTNLRTGATTTLASAGLVEPQGLVIDGTGAIYVSDDIADVIIKLTPQR
jgi:DNA-binding beta-propeller fold protein YncE